MIGAVVGTQPFGGEGLSGTGPKAGGPLYLMRLVRGNPLPSQSLRAPDEPPLFETLVGWIGSGQSLAGDSDAAQLMERAAAYRERIIVGQRLVLPGPTGEDNTLGFHPRGPVLCLSDTALGMLHQLLAAFACGADAVLPQTAISADLLSRLPRALALHIHLTQDWAAGTFAAVLHDGPAADSRRLRGELAARPGPIISLVEAAPLYDLGYLVVERCITLNTAAAGGNARLATLEA